MFASLPFLGGEKKKDPRGLPVPAPSGDVCAVCLNAVHLFHCAEKTP